MTQLILYISILAFICLFVARTIRLARLPAHLRWELYPIPGKSEDTPDMHEPNGSAGKSAAGRLIEELKYMAHEILLFRTYYRRRRGYWCLVYPLHVAMYLFIAWTLLVFLGALLLLSGFRVAAVSTALPMQALFWLTVVAGGGAFSFGFVSSGGLLIKRLVDRDLRLCTTPVIYFNLGFALAIFASGLVNWLWWDWSFSIAREYLKCLLSFTPAPGIPLAMSLQILLTSCFMVYLPCTRMLHFVAKYFIFHKVLWDEQRSGVTLQQEGLRTLLRQTVNWSAPHIRTGASWKEVAS
jgi:nitrate reductase gamma subunit